MRQLMSMLAEGQLTFRGWSPYIAFRQEKAHPKVAECAQAKRSRDRFRELDSNADGSPRRTQPFPDAVGTIGEPVADH